MKFYSAELFLVAIFAFLRLSSIVDAYTGLIPPDPAFPGKCVYRGDDLKLGVNNGIAPCQRLTCYEDGSLLIEGCGRLRIKDCNQGDRLNADKPYPECCTIRYKCKRANGSSFFIERDANNQESNKTENST